MDVESFEDAEEQGDSCELVLVQALLAAMLSRSISSAV